MLIGATAHVGRNNYSNLMLVGATAHVGRTTTLI